MFAKGTKIMYGNTGVCEVMDYATPDLPGMPRGTKYYVLRPLFQSGTIYCPVEQPKVFMRPVMSREEAEELVALIPTISVEPFHTGRLQELSEHYRSIIGTHSTTDLVEIIKSVYSKKREAEAAGRRVSQMDDRYMKLAEELLHGELSNCPAYGTCGLWKAFLRYIVCRIPLLWAHGRIYPLKVLKRRWEQAVIQPLL